MYNFSPLVYPFKKSPSFIMQTVEKREQKRKKKRKKAM
jgi:hypothetical protein